jgi:hypothetical protein
MTTKTEKMNIYQKLLKIQQAVMGLGKDKDTKSPQNPNGYAYVTGAKVLDNIKPLMNELGLILKQEVLSSTNVRMDYNTKFGSKTEILTKLDMKFTWIDTETGEKDENLFGANGQNDYEKGYGSALTYAERYFLLKYFHIATDEDDIDNPERKPENTTPNVPIDYKKTLEDCNSLEQLKVAFTALPKEQKELLLATKDTMKELLEQVELIGTIKTLLALEAYEAQVQEPWKSNVKIKALLDKRRTELTK